MFYLQPPRHTSPLHNSDPPSRPRSGRYRVVNGPLVSSARRDLRGGRPATVVPTATICQVLYQQLTIRHRPALRHPSADPHRRSDKMQLRNPR